MAKRFSIINFKGGVGKTTLAFNVAAGLARYHKPSKVLVVDVDHQSSLSILCLGGKEWTKAAQGGEVINGVFNTFLKHGTLPGDEIVHTTALNPTHYGTLHVVPASLQLDDIEIELTASHQGNAIHSEWNKRTLLCRWLGSEPNQRLEAGGQIMIPRL